MQKRIVCLALVLLMALTALGAAPAAPDERQQRVMLETWRSRWDRWDSTEEYCDTWLYTFTDLDRNGRMEVITASLQGTGLFTYVDIWEINESFDGLNELTAGSDEFDGWPDLIQQEWPCYTDAEGRSYYVLVDYVRDGAAHCLEAQFAVSLTDGTLERRLLAGAETLYTDGGENVTVTYYDSEGRPLSEAEYEGIAERVFAGYTPSTLTLDWARVDRERETPAFQPVVITKNPTSEAIEIGGRTWFIAHAENAGAPYWQAVRPNGTVCTLETAIAENPGLELEELEQDTLAVRNAPLSLDGWGFQAVFAGYDTIAATEPAYLFVGDYMALYESVLNAYRTAYQTGNNTGEYAWTHGLSEIIAYSEHVGYAFKDLNKDGIPELILAGIGTEDFSDGMLYALYTLSGGEPVALAISQARMRYYLRTDNTVLYFGSGGAAYSYHTVERLGGKGELEEMDMLFTNPETDVSGEVTIGYYYQTGPSDSLPSEKSVRIAADEYDDRLERFESGVYLPPLSKLA